jgi:DNA ligase (NAD+)
VDALRGGGKSLGGRAASSANTDYVVAGEGGGCRLEEARERGITVMDEEELTNFLEERGADGEAN